MIDFVLLEQQLSPEEITLITLKYPWGVSAFIEYYSEYLDINELEHTAEGLVEYFEIFDIEWQEDMDFFNGPYNPIRDWDN